MNWINYLRKYNEMKFLWANAVFTAIILHRMVLCGAENDVDESSLIIHQQRTCICCYLKTLDNFNSLNLDSSGFEYIENLEYSSSGNPSNNWHGGFVHVRCLVFKLFAVEQLMKLLTKLKGAYANTSIKIEESNVLCNFFKAFYPELVQPKKLIICLIRQALGVSLNKDKQLMEHATNLLFHLYIKENGIINPNIGEQVNTGEQFVVTEKLKFMPFLRFLFSVLRNSRDIFKSKLLHLVCLHSEAHKELIERNILTAVASADEYKLKKESATFFVDLFGMCDLYFLHLIFHLDQVFDMRPCSLWMEFIRKGNCYPQYVHHKPFSIFRHIFIGLIITKIKNMNENKELKQFTCEYLDIYNNCVDNNPGIDFLNREEINETINGLVSKLNKLKTRANAYSDETVTHMLKPYFLLLEMKNLTLELERAKNRDDSLFIIQWPKMKQGEFKYISELIYMLECCKNGFESMACFIMDYTDFKYLWKAPVDKILATFNTTIINKQGLDCRQTYYLYTALNYILIDDIFSHNNITYKSNYRFETAKSDTEMNNLISKMIIHYSFKIAQLMRFIQDMNVWHSC